MDLKDKTLGPRALRDFSPLPKWPCGAMDEFGDEAVMKMKTAGAISGAWAKDK